MLSSDSSFMSLSIPEAVRTALNNHKTIEVQIDFLIKTDSGNGYGAYINPYPLSSQASFTSQFILQNGNNVSGGHQQASGWSIFIGDTGSEGVISGVSKILITSPVGVADSVIEFAGTSSLAFNGASGSDRCYWINSRSWASASSVTSFRLISSKSGAKILAGSSATAVFKVFG